MYAQSIYHRDASTIKYTTPLSCIGSSESASELYINFEICEGKNHKHLKKHIGPQSQVIYVDKLLFMKGLHILEDKCK